MTIATKPVIPPGLREKPCKPLNHDDLAHFGTDDRRRIFCRFVSHAHSGAPLMFTSGTAEGEAIGVYGKEPLYHASLAPAEYEQLLATNGFVVRAYVAEDPQCGGHTVWLATCDAEACGPASR